MLYDGIMVQTPQLALLSGREEGEPIVFQVHVLVSMSTLELKGSCRATASRTVTDGS